MQNNHIAARALDDSCRLNKPILRAHFSDDFSTARPPIFWAQFSDDLRCRPTDRLTFWGWKWREHNLFVIQALWEIIFAVPVFWTNIFHFPWNFFKFFDEIGKNCYFPISNCYVPTFRDFAKIFPIKLQKKAKINSRED